MRLDGRFHPFQRLSIRGCNTLENITENQFYGPNLGYVLELYERYREDPGSVDERTRSFFENWSPPDPGANGQATAQV
ncbi:MAG TPA: hypothetical protein VK359_07390, partial [Rubrobacteraceae bacterium]|nr:hypothetical protein [Rubrobacteraceae bacterium]